MPKLKFEFPIFYNSFVTLYFVFHPISTLVLVKKELPIIYNIFILREFSTEVIA